MGKWLTSTCAYTFISNWQRPLWINGMEKMTIDMISWSISTRVIWRSWDSNLWLLDLQSDTYWLRYGVRLSNFSCFCSRSQCLSRMRIQLMIRRLWVWSPPIRQHSFMEIDHKIFSTVILSLPLTYERRAVVSFRQKNLHKYWLATSRTKPAQ